ncbi:hypothetical protein [Cerasicoccus arenae]|uniref:Uncharacterized protein n=1 Tax=Cerasicoccus arenae TaxID=424488 RepID=A0A8J3GEL2_9BACT|nr:hypothetical protein [Cerasicoccus arenae]MBK1858389.1 hypothetical protein [Cerasicoccus arenae]GHC09964.1 hypothetical protein GCM10007047_29180 [Cerasicoccus arenae]
MNNQTTSNNSLTNQDNAARKRFCDSFGFYGVICLGFFAAFVAMLEYGGKF